MPGMPTARTLLCFAALAVRGHALHSIHMGQACDTVDRSPPMMAEDAIFEAGAPGKCNFIPNDKLPAYLAQDKTPTYFSLSWKFVYQGDSTPDTDSAPQDQCRTDKLTQLSAELVFFSDPACEAKHLSLGSVSLVPNECVDLDLRDTGILLRVNGSLGDYCHIVTTENRLRTNEDTGITRSACVGEADTEPLLNMVGKCNPEVCTEGCCQAWDYDKCESKTGVYYSAATMCDARNNVFMAIREFTDAKCTAVYGDGNLNSDYLNQNAQLDTCPTARDQQHHVKYVLRGMLSLQNYCTYLQHRAATDGFGFGLNGWGKVLNEGDFAAFRITMDTTTPSPDLAATPTPDSDSSATGFSACLFLTLTSTLAHLL